MPDLWFRMYANIVNDPKVQTLPPELFKWWVNFLAFAKNQDGYLPPPSEIAWTLRCEESEVEIAQTKLISKGLIDSLEGGDLYMHSWNKRQFVSDVSTERVREHRLRQRETVMKRSTKQVGNVSCNGSETCSETEYRVQSTEGTDKTEEKTHAPYVALPRNGSVRGFKENSTPVAQRFEEFVRPWPTVADVDGAMRAWLSRVKTTDLEAAFACRDRYLQSDQVKRGVWTEPKKFINTQADSGWVGKWARAATANGISDADKELIAQVERDVESGRKTREERMKQKW